MTARITDQPVAATAGAALPAGPPDRPDAGPARPGFSRRQRAALATLAAVLFAAYTTYAFARHAKYETTGFDLGIFDQVLRAYAHFDEPVSPLKGIGYDILGDHFHPILVLLVPLYWIWADPRMLLAAQAALFAVSVLPVASFARRRFGGRAALVVAAVYGVSWPLQRAVHFDFHEIAFAVPLIALLVDSMDRRRTRLVIGCCLALLLVREDMGALVLLVGLLTALQAPRSRRTALLGGVLAVLGVAGYGLATSVVIPALGPQGFTYWTFTQLGPDPAGALRTMVTRPWRVVQLFFTPAIKVHTLTTIFAATGLLALLSPYVLLTLPFLAERMLNDRELLWSTNFHYTSVIAPILVMAAADTVHRLVRRFPRALATRRVRGRWPVGLVPAWLGWCMAVVLVGMISLSPDYPVSGLWSGRVWVRDARWHAVHDALARIPSGECVEADNQIAPQLTGRDFVTRVGTEVDPDRPGRDRPGAVEQSHGLATWVILDLAMKETGWQGPTPVRAMTDKQEAGYRIVSWQWPIVLMHKDLPVAPMCRGTN